LPEKCLLGVVFVEDFVGRVLKDGKVTVPKRLRSLCGVSDGDYVRLSLVEVLKRNQAGEWVKRRVE
jgi:bifunctional DNA-binding transcriptional regulator/antitoxin component of YhaV-PrlF toxin-antitoxin module